VDVFVSQSDPRPLTAQLYEQLRDAIIEGRLEPGDRLAPTRALAADLRVSRSTVTEVYGRLVAEGFIDGRSGRGSIVAAIAQASVHPPSTPSALEPTARAAAIAGDARTPHSEAAFDLRPGRVDPALFPGRDWRRAVVNALARVSPQYGDPAERRSCAVHWRGGSSAPEASPRPRTSSSSPPGPATASTSSPGCCSTPATSWRSRNLATHRWPNFCAARA
jgi:GntR family transcriptional regulator / MocR family aminotransferase